jgi:hypothetical protein
VTSVHGLSARLRGVKLATVLVRAVRSMRNSAAERQIIALILLGLLAASWPATAQPFSLGEISGLESGKTHQ